MPVIEQKLLLPYLTVYFHDHWRTTGLALALYILERTHPWYLESKKGSTPTPCKIQMSQFTHVCPLIASLNMHINFSEA